MKHTLWSLLKERKIEIPIFQRDYAQGREDKATLRRDILHQLQLSLNGGKSEDGHMDFVYSFGDVTSRPLDGQQRLTTLWLLHWYLAINVLEGKELESALSRLQRFSYRTRRSSSNFIDSLCDMTNVCNLRDNPDIATAIRNCTWFDKAWEKDPTVKGMLLSLSGQPPVNNSGPNGIQPIFEENRNRFNSMWQLLISEKCPIHFDFLTIEDVEVKSPDILYVKMNARGKSLSHFEKFKAQWISLMREIDADKSFHISKSIDTEWNERFWRTDLKTVGLDQRKMAFYSRYFFCCLLNNLCTHQRFKDLNLSEKGKFISDSVLYKNERGSDLCFPFNSIDDFSIILQAENDKDQKNPFSLLTTDAVDNLNDLFRSIERLGNNTITDCLPSYMSDFDFLSGLQKDNNSNKYKEDKDGNYWVKQLTLTQMVVFYALSTYLQISKNRNEQSLKRWMRVCCNIAENTNRNSELPVFINVISKIQELATFSVGDVLGCDDIYNTLLTVVKADEVPNNVLEAVLREERVKAEWLLNGEDSEIAKTIIKSEAHPLLQGRIMPLLLSEDCQIDEKGFVRRWEIFKEKFNEKGAVDKEVCVEAMRVIFSYLPFDSIYWNKYIFKNAQDVWKNDLLRDEYKIGFSKFINGKEALNYPITDKIGVLCSPGVLEKIIEINKDFYIRDPDCAIRPYGDMWNGIRLHQNNVLKSVQTLLEIPGVDFEDNDVKLFYENHNCKLVWGVRITFTYKNHTLHLWDDCRLWIGDICLTNETGESIYLYNYVENLSQSIDMLIDKAVSMK